VVFPQSQRRGTAPFHSVTQQHLTAARQFVTTCRSAGSTDNVCGWYRATFVFYNATALLQNIRYGMLCVVPSFHCSVINLMRGSRSCVSLSRSIASQEPCRTTWQKSAPMLADARAWRCCPGSCFSLRRWSLVGLVSQLCRTQGLCCTGKLRSGHGNTQQRRAVAGGGSAPLPCSGETLGVLRPALEPPT